jgi:hypothetical protein
MHDVRTYQGKRIQACNRAMIPRYLDTRRHGADERGTGHLADALRVNRTLNAHFCMASFCSTVDNNHLSDRGDWKTQFLRSSRMLPRNGVDNCDGFGLLRGRGTYRGMHPGMHPDVHPFCRLRGDWSSAQPVQQTCKHPTWPAKASTQCM